MELLQAQREQAPRCSGVSRGREVRAREGSCAVQKPQAGAFRLLLELSQPLIKREEQIHAANLKPADKSLAQQGLREGHWLSLEHPSLREGGKWGLSQPNGSNHSP